MERKMKTRTFTGSTDPSVKRYETEHGAIARKAAAEGMVLLKNAGNLLPIAPGSTLALFGAGASMTVKGGTGSGDVNERVSISIYQGLKDAGYKITSEEWISGFEGVYRQKRQEWKEQILKKAENTDFFTAYSTTPFSVPAGPAVTESDADIAVYVLSRVAGEGSDRKAEDGDYFLSDEEYTMISDICGIYDKVMLIVNTGGVTDLSFLDQFPQIKAVLYVSQPGQEGGHALADVVSGQTTPCGKLTDTWALEYEAYPNAVTFSHMNGDVEKELYEEGIYVGYRFFDSFGIPARYGFGYGLSYTEFSMETGDITADADGTVHIPVTVTNTGKRYSGREVVQIYASLPKGRLEKEYRRLCAFAKTSLLAPGECESMELTFTPEELASYDEIKPAWILEPGLYGIFVGNSLDSSVLTASLQLEEEKILAHTAHICPLQEELEEMTNYEEDVEMLHNGFLENAEKLPKILWDLSEVKTVEYSYDWKEPEDEASGLAAELTEEQLIGLVVGDPEKGQDSQIGSAGVSVPGSAGETGSCALGQGIANIVLADGPAGLRLHQRYAVKDGHLCTMPVAAAFEHGYLYDGSELEGTVHYQYCTAFPVGTLLAQTWDTDLLEEVGQAVAEEMEMFGVTLWLAPGMNIHRNPLCGRNFEYYSEDPLVSGKMAAAITKGVQSRPGCGTTIKHFACNNQEDNRTGSDSILSERALREIYLRGFGIAVREAQPMALMTSYNRINGIHAANNYDLCMKAVRCEFGFRGVIMTDWCTTNQGDECCAAGCMKAGNDLVMPGMTMDRDDIRQSIADGVLTEKELCDCASRLIRVILASNAYER